MSYVSSGNSVVDALGQMDFTGNIIQEGWYHTIQDHKGHADFITICILAEIVYWYRPKVTINERSNTVTYHKKFRANDFVQISYEQICDKLNISRKQAMTAYNKLESLGIIQRHKRTINVRSVKCSNVLYIELFPDTLKKYTFFESEKLDTNLQASSLQESSSLPTRNNILSNMESATEHKDTTNTKITTNINTQNTTTEVVINNMLKPFVLSSAEINKLIDISEGDMAKIESAINILKNYKTDVSNPIGFLFSAIKNNYTKKSYHPVTKASFNDFHQRKYDYEKLEEIANVFSSPASDTSIN